jgi:hypothetical protein
MVQLRLVREDGLPVGTINWFAVHPTSMNNTNILVSSDNVGYAAILFEQRMNPGRLIGKVMSLPDLLPDWYIASVFFCRIYTFCFILCLHYKHFIRFWTERGVLH